MIANSKTIAALPSLGEPITSKKSFFWWPSATPLLTLDHIGDAGSAATYICCESPWFETEAQIARNNLERVVSQPDFVNARCPSSTTALTIWADNMYRTDVDPASMRFPRLQQLMSAISYSSIDYLLLGNVSGFRKRFDKFDELEACCRANGVPILLSFGSRKPKLLRDATEEDYNLSFCPPAKASLGRFIYSWADDFEKHQQNLANVAG